MTRALQLAYLILGYGPVFFMCGVSFWMPYENFSAIKCLICFLAALGIAECLIWLWFKRVAQNQCTSEIKVSSVKRYRNGLTFVFLSAVVPLIASSITSTAWLVLGISFVILVLGYSRSAGYCPGLEFIGYCFYEIEVSDSKGVSFLLITNKSPQSIVWEPIEVKNLSEDILIII